MRHRIKYNVLHELLLVTAFTTECPYSEWAKYFPEKAREIVWIWESKVSWKHYSLCECFLRKRFVGGWVERLRGCVSGRIPRITIYAELCSGFWSLTVHFATRRARERYVELVLPGYEFKLLLDFKLFIFFACFSRHFLNLTNFYHVLGNNLFDIFSELQRIVYRW